MGQMLVGKCDNFLAKRDGKGQTQTKLWNEWNGCSWLKEESGKCEQCCQVNETIIHGWKERVANVDKVVERAGLLVAIKTK